MDAKQLTGRMRDHPLYNIWRCMKSRCSNPRRADFKHYGARGIAVCDRWKKDFLAFLSDVPSRPSMKHTLDRIDRNGGYEPGNVRWATQTEQLRNQSRNRLIDFGGATKCLSEWAEEMGISKAVIHSRLRLGWSIDRTLTTPVRGIRRWA